MPTLTEVQELIAAAKTHVSNMHAQMEDAENAYNRRLRLPVKFPSDAVIQIPSTAPAIVDHFTDQVRTDNPQVTLGPLGSGPKTEARRDRLQAFGRWLLEQTILHEDEPFMDYATFGLAALGAGVLRVTFDEDLFQRGEWPFGVRYVHPMNIYVSPGHRWPYAYVVETQTRFYGEIKADYDHWIPEPKKAGDRWKLTDEVPVVLYWDAETHAMWAGGALVYEVDNVLGLPPFVWSFSGLGHKAGDGDPAAQAVSILHHAMDEIISQAILRTAATNVWLMSVWPTMFGTIPEAEFKSKWGAGLGRYIEVKEMDEKPEWQEPPQLNQNMWAMLPELDRSIERSTFSSVLQGESTAEFGVVMGLQLGQARLRVDAVRNAIERMMGRVLGIQARYVEQTMKKAGFEFEGRKINKSDISGFMDFRVGFEAIDPFDDDRRIQTGLALRTKNPPDISRQTFLRDFLRVKDVTGEEDQIRLEQMVDQLLAQGFGIQAVLGLVQNEESRNEMMDAILEIQQGTGQNRRDRGAPFGLRNGTVEPGEEGPSDSARTPPQ